MNAKMHWNQNFIFIKYILNSMIARFILNIFKVACIGIHIVTEMKVNM